MQALRESRAAADGIAEAQPRHGIGFGEGPKNHQIRILLQVRDQALCLRNFGKIQEAFVDHWHTVLISAELQDLSQFFPSGHKACRIVGIGEEEQFRVSDVFRQVFPVQEKALSLLPGHGADLTILFPKCLFVLSEIRRCEQRFLRAQYPADSEDQIRGAVSADDLCRRDAVPFSQPGPKPTAEGIRVPLCILQCLYCRLTYSLRQSQRADICREIQRQKAVFCFISGPVAAVCFCHNSFPSKMIPSLITPSRTRHSQLPACSILQARRMSSASASRRASPI